LKNGLKCNVDMNSALKIFSDSVFSIWLIGLSGAGKTTLAHLISKKFEENSSKLVVLDGDMLRTGINKDLGFSLHDRKENIRRVAEISRLFNLNGISTINAFICPTHELQEIARDLSGKGYVEVFVDTPIEECELRDPKGLYKKCRNGEISEFTGVSSPFEKPVNPDFVMNTLNETPQYSAEKLFTFLTTKTGY
jgi:adenylyl-sulfate kinase